MRRSFLFFITLYLFSLSVFSQKIVEKGRTTTFIDCLLDYFVSTKLDTAYAVRHGSRFTIRPKIGISFGQLDFGWRNTETGKWHSYALFSRPAIRMGANASYRTLTIGYQANVSDLFLGNGGEDVSYGASLYGTTWGGDCFYNISRQSKVKQSKNHTLHTRWLDCFRIKRLQANLYYVFNNRRFAYPAAFTQSYRQRISCGSFIAGLSANYCMTTLDADNLPGDIQAKIPSDGLFSSMHYSTVSVNFGYAYNWVLGKAWLLHASVLPSVDLYKDSSLRPLKGEGSMQMNDFSFGCIARMGALYQYERSFFGLSAVVYFKCLEFSPYQISDIYVSSRLFFGIRF